MMKSFLVICLILTGLPDPAIAQTLFPAKRWLYLASNLLVEENLVNNAALLQRAKQAGYNGVLFTDFKLGYWWKEEGIARRYRQNAEKFRKTVRDLGLEFAVAIMPFGYAGAWLVNDPNLAGGVPVRDCPMIVEKGELRPEATVSLKNGSFEKFQGDKIAGASYQDDPGSVTFVDAETKHEGTVSLRLSPKPGGPENVRIFFKLKVKPWQHYRLRCWMKADALNAEAVRLNALAGNESLQWQHVSRPGKEERKLERFERAKNLTFDWTEQLVDLNTLGHEEITVVVGLWGAKSGHLWLDDLAIDSAPTLNLLRRDDLPLQLKTSDGRVVEEGIDVEPVKDEKMGRIPWNGEYSTRHAPPPIRLTANSRLKEGERILLSTYHPHLIYDGQVNCSMLSPQIWQLAREEVEQTVKLLEPDILYLSHDEIRSMGWEPAEQKYPNAGAALAENIRQAQVIAKKAGGNRPLMVWSDMFDPHHNAKKEFYLTHNGTEGSWEGLEPSTWIMKWGEGDADKSLDFFQKRGHKLMVAAFYDHDVKQDAEQWKKTLEKGAPVEGIMYTTWNGDYSQLEAFAKLWWPDQGK